MFTRRLSASDPEAGFTLIELLVVIIIIGILGAIAIPIYLSTRAKAYNAGVKSDLRNAASAEEAYLTDHDSYTNVLNDLQGQGFTKTAGVTMAGAYAGAQGYCLVANSVPANPVGGWRLYDSENGGPQLNPFNTEAAAELACTVAGLGSWATIY